MTEKYMRGVAAVGGGDVELVRDVPVPEIGPYEALVRMKSCGFCNGTDFHIIRGEMSVEVDTFPTLLGHEGVGDIVELGGKVRNYKIGDRFMNPMIKLMPGTRYGCTWGAMCDYGIVQDQKAMVDDGEALSLLNPRQLECVQIPSDFDAIDGGCLITLNECFSAARNFDVEDKDVLVYGAGPMGLATMKYMRHLGARTIVAIDGVEERLALARSLSGADETINYTKVDKKEVLKGRIFDRVIDIVGQTSILLEGSHLLKPYGIIGSMGVLRNTDAMVDVTKLKNNTRLQMLNFPYGQYDITAENIRLIEKGVIHPKDFYSHVMNVEDIQEAVRLVAEKEAVKVILDLEN